MTPTSSESLGTIFLLGGLSLFILWMGAKKGFFEGLSSDCTWKIPLRWFHVAGAFCLYFAVVFVVAPLTIPLLRSFFPIGSGDTAYISVASWINFLNSLLILLALSLFSLRKTPRSWPKLWRSDENPTPYGESIRFAAFAWALSFPLVLFLTQMLDWLTTTLFHLDHLPEQLAVHFLKMTFAQPLYLALAIVTIVFFAPLIEETLFRGYLQSFIRQHLGSKQAIFITSVLFAFFHYAPEQGLGNIPIVGSLFALALFLGICYEKKKSLLSPMALHASFNAVSVINLYFFGEFPPNSI